MLNIVSNANTVYTLFALLWFFYIILQTKATLFNTLSLSRSPISSYFLLGSPLPPIRDSRIAQLKVPWAKIRYFGAHDIWQSFTSPKVFYSTELFRICSSFKVFHHLKSIFLNALLKSLLKTVYMT